VKPRAMRIHPSSFLAVLLTFPILFAKAAVADGPEKRPMTFLQLIATRYPKGASLPAEGMPPALSANGFVDKALLPPGARVLSAAQGTGGAIWIITDRGAFRSEERRVGKEC